MGGQRGEKSRKEEPRVEEPRDEGASDDELENWPLIGAEGPKHKIEFPERWRLEEAVDVAILYVRTEIKRLGIKDPLYLDQENGVQYRFLLDTMLKYSRTPEQICNMVNGYLNFCMRESGQFKSPMLETIRGGDFNHRIQVIDQSFYGPSKMHSLKGNLGDKKYSSLEKYSRNPVLDTVTHGLAQGPVYRYGREPFYDGAYFLMGDPTSVDHDGIDAENTVVTRNVPDEKRMTKEKLARLLQFPNLEQFIIADRDMKEPKLGSNLAIIAEYFCENNGAVYLNAIDSTIIANWLGEKFAKHNPPLEVAYYVWARFQQTEFEEAASFIESYIFGLHEKNDPWLFEAAGEKPGIVPKPGQIFRIYSAALQKLQTTPDDPNYHRLLEIMPGKEIVLPFTKSKTAGYGESLEIYLSEFKIPPNHVAHEYSRERFMANPAQVLIALLNEKEVMLEEWEGYEGFELLDPFAIQALQGSLRSWAVGLLQQNALKSLDKMSLTDLFVFRNVIVSELENSKLKVELEKVIAVLIDKAYGEALSHDISVELLTDMVRGKEVDLRQVIPAVAALPPDLRRAPSSGRLPELAEAALLAQQFKGARGGDAIVKFLLANRYSMNPVELIMPFPDAPNLEIIRLYKESPNLLLLLSMSTILMYLGYSHGEILKIVDELVERTEKDSRAELSTVGLEWEQVGGVNGRVIATDDFAHLFNVLPRGNDAGCNEILSLPSTSTEAQAALMALITNPASGYLDTEALWAAEKEAGQPLSSLHINVGLPAELGFSQMEMAAQVDPIIKATWIAHGGDVQSHMSKGVARRWASDSLLDVFGDKDRGTKLEIKNAALEQDGSHTAEIDHIFLIASACMQHARSARGIGTSSAGAIMGEIFAEFRTEVDRLKFSIDEADSAKRLLAEYAAKVKAELGL
jgi:hypothetical protein